MASLVVLVLGPTVWAKARNAAHAAFRVTKLSRCVIVALRQDVLVPELRLEERLPRSCPCTYVAPRATVPLKRPALRRCACPHLDRYSMPWLSFNSVPWCCSRGLGFRLRSSSSIAAAASTRFGLVWPLILMSFRS